nr:dTDP-4-dehydrorhamnose reductase [Sphingomonas sp.]
MKRTILVTGGAGQVGIELLRLKWPDSVEVYAPARNELDITSSDSVAACFAKHNPQCVINCAAYTAVDKAEEEVATAFLVNAQGPAFLADAARRGNAPIIHVSTDYVFDGSADRPYRESDPTAPVNAYGASKLAGELAVRAANPHSVVLRTAWVLSAHRANFIKTMLRLGASNPSLRVVADQRGCPTSAKDIAETLQRIARRALDNPDTPWGTYHFVNSGETSWHGLAEHIFARSGGARPEVQAIPTSAYPTPARRPANSRLATRLIGEKLGIVPRPWQDAVDEILAELGAMNQGERQSI